MADQWPPNYAEVFAKRAEYYRKMIDNPNLIVGAKEYYRDHIKEFINDWCVVYEPRNAGTDKPTFMPFSTFRRQGDFIDFVVQCYQDKEHGLVEKCRTVGATWLACAISTAMWLFQPGVAIGFGSNKANKVDELGNADSILEKVRIIIDYLPRFFWPAGFERKKHALRMKIINPENGSTITGEGGDNIGRGGRKTLYWSDEAAHWERPEQKEAALSETTDVQIALSSVYGTANLFARRRLAGVIWEPHKEIAPGKTRVFIFDWRDHPHMTQEWYEKKRKKAEQEGLLHIFAQEIDRDYAAAVEGVLIPQQWVKAAVDAHNVLGFEADGMKMGALDVADEGGDRNAFVMRKGVVLQYLESWSRGDGGETTRKTISLLRTLGCKVVQYDSAGPGASVKSEYNRQKKENGLTDVVFVPWNGGFKVLYGSRRLIERDKESPRIKDFFANLKAQGWWMLRRRFEKTFSAVVKGQTFDPAELISIPSDLPERFELEQELSQPTYSLDGKGKIVVNKKPDGSRSPDRADDVMMCYWPIPQKRVLI